MDCPFVSTNADEEDKRLRNPSILTATSYLACKGDLPIKVYPFWDSTGGGGLMYHLQLQ